MSNSSSYGTMDLNRAGNSGGARRGACAAPPQPTGLRRHAEARPRRAAVGDPGGHDGRDSGLGPRRAGAGPAAAAVILFKGDTESNCVMHFFPSDLLRSPVGVAGIYYVLLLGSPLMRSSVHVQAFTRSLLSCLLGSSLLNLLAYSGEC